MKNLYKKDCFAYSENNKNFQCKALDVDNCINCNFYKIKRDYLVREE